MYPFNSFKCCRIFVPSTVGGFYEKKVWKSRKCVCLFACLLACLGLKVKGQTHIYRDSEVFDSRHSTNHIFSRPIFSPVRFLHTWNSTNQKFFEYECCRVTFYCAGSGNQMFLTSSSPHSIVFRAGCLSGQSRSPPNSRPVRSFSRREFSQSRDYVIWLSCNHVFDTKSIENEMVFQYKLWPMEYVDSTRVKEVNVKEYSTIR